MPADLFEERFVGHRQPAWHRLGKVFDEDVTVTDAWLQLPPYRVIQRPLLYPTPTGNQPSGYHILGSTRDGATIQHAYATVTDQYVLLPPDQFVDILAEAAGGRGIETMGALAKGSILFVTYKLADTAILDDEHSQYMLFTARCDGRANEFAYTSVRVVCANTLNIALSRSARVDDVATLIHRAGLVERTRAWLHEAFGLAAEKHAAIREVFIQLAQAPVDEPAIAATLESAFPNPTAPKYRVNPSTYGERHAAWEREVAKQALLRTQTRELFDGKAAGSDLRSFQGSAYGLLNAVVELVDHGMPGTNEETAAQAALFGYRADIKQRAAATLLERCLNN